MDLITYALLKKKIDPTGDLTELKSAVRELQGDVSSLETSVDENTDDISALQNVISGLQSGFTYKGTVATVSALPANADVGDCYTVTAEDNAEYLWDGTNWIDIGSSITTITTAQINALFS